MKIAVYCSANNDIAEEYYDAARRLGEWIAASGHTLVWGGGNCGLMGCIGDTVHAHGGRTIGMVPRALEKTGRVSDNIDVYIPTNGLDDRKELMIAQSDIAVALPGGIGTLDEIFTQAGSNTIGFHSKKVILYNVHGFWDTTIALLEFMQDNGMVRGHWTDYIVVAKGIEEIDGLVV
ncbi:MAG: TIGR00730 family Rossman fold protein [Prevotella sp.]|nr:TIGR00730 family Rossman fold protein [Prevotella sp.]MDE6151055.1 TIGR00730 family Rossman fold protein [Prevotella sp.]